MSLGEILRQKRLLNRHKLKKVAEEIGVSTRFLSYIEKGERKPGRVTLFKICKFYGCSLDELPCE